ncbi:MAG: hypothetical protein DME26_03595, partial [Verrucomicrobia bacterium]
TLLELMVVLILIGIMSAIIIPEMKGSFQDALLRSTSRELVNVFNLASSRAISINQLHRVRLDRNSGRYVVERRAQENEQAEGFVPAREIPGSEGKLDTRISIEIRMPDEPVSDARDQAAAVVAGNDTPLQLRDEVISFYPDGTSDAREILLRDREGFRVALRLNPITARVHLIELERQ